MRTYAFQDYLERNYKTIWSRMMLRCRERKDDFVEKWELHDKVWEQIFAELPDNQKYMASCQEFRDEVTRLHFLNTPKRKHDKPKPPSLGSERKSLLAKRKEIDKALKELKNKHFSGSYYRVRPPTGKNLGHRLQMKSAIEVGITPNSHKWETIIRLPEVVANDLARTLEEKLIEWL